MDIQAKFLARTGFAALLDRLQSDGYRCIGPTEQNGAIVFDELHGVADLPQGVVDEQAPGHYRLHHTRQPHWFLFTTPAQGIKPFLFAPREPLWRSTEDTHGELHFEARLPQWQPLAIIGARACDLSALLVQDLHFNRAEHGDAHYQRRRADLFVVAVQCTRSTATCFCNSTGDGPQAQSGYDLRLTELETGFIVQAGTERGERLMQGLPLEAAPPASLAEAEAKVEQAAVQQRTLPSVNLERALFDNLQHPRWQEVAQRCLSCANCTSVCPTCFCYRELDEGEFGQMQRDHLRVWDSCFTQPHSYIHGITIRAETTQRYRQWMTHKLGSWHSQYGRSGCTGCGRCITWCPTGIDITEEAHVICGNE